MRYRKRGRGICSSRSSGKGPNCRQSSLGSCGCTATGSRPLAGRWRRPHSTPLPPPPTHAYTLPTPPPTRVSCSGKRSSMHVSGRHPSRCTCRTTCTVSGTCVPCQRIWGRTGGREGGGGQGQGQGQVRPGLGVVFGGGRCSQSVCQSVCMHEMAGGRVYSSYLPAVWWSTACRTAGCGTAPGRGCPGRVS